jgi:hypothetical protein
MSAAPAAPFWMQNIKHQGIAAFNLNSTTYQVFRNVKDFGAKVVLPSVDALSFLHNVQGDGITDDTEGLWILFFFHFWPLLMYYR